MLRESVFTDITINAAGGSIRAHRAVLAARSPVFLSMFSHALREKELSTVDTPDMSIAACRAFVRYIYGASVSEEELLAHRSVLVAAGDKYCIANLKETCEKSLGKDVGTENVLQRLQMAHTYSLAALKRTCLRLLVDFGKMYEIPEDFAEFVKSGDQELVGEIMEKIAVFRGRMFPPTTSSVMASTSSPAPPPTAGSSASNPEPDRPALLRRSTRLKIQDAQINK
jgi:speckle-type POZ protein